MIQALKPSGARGAKVISRGRTVTFQMAEIATPRQMFQKILRLIAELRPKPPPAPARDNRSSGVPEHMTGGLRSDAKQNKTHRRQERLAGLGLQATRHQKSFREGRIIAIMCLKSGPLEVPIN